MNEGYKASRKQEKRGAKDFGGYTNPRSGAGDWHKNDVRTDELSIEFKTTSKRQYILKHDELVKAEEHALRDSRDMVFVIEMCGREWAVVSKEDLISLLDGQERC